MRPTVRCGSLVLVLAALGGSVSAGQPGATYQLTRQAIKSGGGAMDSGQMTLSGTLGQQEAIAVSLSSEGYALAGGFWAQASPTGFTDVLFRADFETGPQQ